jgi:hypothetical protein
MAGSSGSGEDMESGRTNMAESSTLIGSGRPSELDVPFNGIVTFGAGPRRDEQRPDTAVSGVMGRGWNGLAPGPAGSGVIGIGAPNRGPGMVGLGGGHRITSSFLGSPGNLGESGQGGTGMVGIGGPGDPEPDSTAASDVFAEAGSMPGAGGVGQGGRSFFPTPVAGSGDPGTGNGAGLIGIAGGRMRAPNADLSQTDLSSTSNVGVVGFGGDGPKEINGSFVGPVSAGAGMRGVGGTARDRATGQEVGGPGVVGVAGTAEVPADADITEIGVFGIGRSGPGVLGRAPGFPGVMGTSEGAAGVFGSADRGVGVAGYSEGAVGGHFASARVAQVHLEPLRDPITTPNGVIKGEAGDLLAIRSPREEQLCSLWFCRTSGTSATAIWVQLA